MAERDRERDLYFMTAALEEAAACGDKGEVPVGAVIVRENKILVRCGNGREQNRDATAHAELSAIREACKILGGWHLTGCELYVTLEPCQMCAGALVQARMTEVVIGCMNPKAGCAGPILNLLEMPEFNHQVKVVRGVMEEECSALLKDFFKELRARLKEEKKSGEETGLSDTGRA